MRVVDEQDDMFSVVRRAWTDTLPCSPFDPERSWEDAGADSLKSLHLVLRLERALGRKISFDLISREMTALTLAERLGREIRLEGSDASHSALATVFLMPGLLGDEPILADFRRSLGGSVAFEVVELPDLDIPTNVHSDMARTGQFVAEEIMRRSPTGEINLVGFSFGGSVAFEAAHHLRRCGRTVSFLAVLDTFFDPVPPTDISSGDTVLSRRSVDRQALGGQMQSFSEILRRLLPRSGERSSEYRDRLVFAAVMRCGLFEIGRRMALAGRTHFKQDQPINHRRVVLGLSRQRAIRDWTPQPLEEVSALIVCSDDGLRSDLFTRWESLCPKMRRLHVPGKHLEMFNGRALKLLTPVFRDAVMEAEAGGW